jgi:hypothetical protein
MASGVISQAEPKKHFGRSGRIVFFHHIRSTGRRREGDGALLPGNFRLV